MGLPFSVAAIEERTDGILIDAQEFQSKELRQSAAEELDTRFDGFTRTLLSWG